MLKSLLSFLRTLMPKSAVIEASAAAKRESWTFEPAHTHIGFSVRHLGLTDTPGNFRRFDAIPHALSDNVRLTIATEITQLG
jgi:polyisoprenoid-binding protein YceI